jgi:integrase
MKAKIHVPESRNLRKAPEENGLKDETKRLLGVLDGFTGNVSALLIRFLLFTGLRRGEVVQILWEDVDPDFQLERIRMENTKNH